MGHEYNFRVINAARTIGRVADDLGKGVAKIVDAK